MRKVAFCSKDTIQRVIVGFIARASGRKDTQQFSSESEAVKWILK
jgi:hypothetical protein